MTDSVSLIQPSGSRTQIEVECNNQDLDDLTLNISNEAAEIARLQLPNEQAATEVEQIDDDRIPQIEFCCKNCGMHEMVHYLGQTPPFAQGMQFIEDTFVMRDPFQPPPPRWQSKPEYYIAIGAPCSKCTQSVCKDGSCSFFYSRTYCLPCAANELKLFPLEVQAKLRKQLADNGKH